MKLNDESPIADSLIRPSIAVGDSSALYYWMHSAKRVASIDANDDFLLRCKYASSLSELGQFNVDHPLFGGAPVTVLVPDRALRARSKRVTGCLCSGALPDGSFAKLREGLYIATPELTFSRMGNARNEVELAEIGTNLCARFFLDIGDSSINERHAPLTSPERLSSYVGMASELRGSKKAARALRWVLPNSGSPMETKVQLLFRLPWRMGGFALPFTHMNFDIEDKRSVRLYEQKWYCVDLANPRLKIALEYDGEAYHRVVSVDIRRRNALKAIDWEVFPLDKAILCDADATEKLALQVAKRMGVRIQRSDSWRAKHVELRKSLRLPL